MGVVLESRKADQVEAPTLAVILFNANEAAPEL
jgi:hypothetical protein